MIPEGHFPLHCFLDGHGRMKRKYLWQNRAHREVMDYNKNQARFRRELSKYEFQRRKPAARHPYGYDGY